MWNPFRTRYNPEPITYDVKVHCNNCGMNFIAEVPTGETVFEHIKDKNVCPYCKCSGTLHWAASAIYRNINEWGKGSTPEEAVANLWLALNKK